MKALLTLIITVFAVHAHADHTPSHTAFQACEEVQAMAILNKDNMPYWTAGKVDVDSEQSCYEDLKSFAFRATPKMISQLEEEYEGAIRIFNNDADFANFIQENNTPSNDFQLQNASTGSMIDTLKPTQALELFSSVNQ